MQYDTPPKTVVSARLYSPLSPMRLVARFDAQSVDAKRRLRSAAIAAFILAAGLLGTAFVACRPRSQFAATAVANLPMHAANLAAVTAPSAVLLARRRAVRALSVAGVSCVGTSLKIQAGSPAGIVVYTATGPSAQAASALARAAANEAVASDRVLWTHRLADPSLGAQAVDSPVAGIVAQPDGYGVQTVPLYGLSWSTGRDFPAAAWLAICAVAAVMVFVKGRAAVGIAPVRRLGWSSSAEVDEMHFEAQPGVEIKVLAGVSLTRPVAHAAASAVPILTDMHPSLWNRLIGGLKPAMSDGGQVVAPPALAREFLIARPTDRFEESWAASIALGRALSRQGLTTVVIDADLACPPALRGDLAFPDTVPGVFDVLVKGIPAADCILEDDEFPGLHGLGPGAQLEQSGAEHLLASAQFLDLLDLLAASFAIVLVHSPPAGKAAMSIAVRVDACLLVVPDDPSAGEIEACRRAVADFVKTESDLIGLIEVHTAGTVPEATRNP